MDVINISITDELDNAAKKDFFKLIKKELYKDFKGGIAHAYLLTYARYLLGLSHKPRAHPKNQKQKEMRNSLYELARECGVTLKNYPDLA